MQSSAEKRVRTCIGCSKKASKLDMFRIVANSDGTLSVDASGKVPGRGTYVCSKECLDTAIAKRKLAHALKRPIAAEDCTMLVEQLEEARRSAEAR